MKRFGLILFVLAWLVGCGGEQTAVSPTTAPVLPTATSLPTVAAAPTTADEPATATPESVAAAPAAPLRRGSDERMQRHERSSRSG